MQANPDKFQVLAVGKKTYEKRPTINIQNFELTCEDSVKLLGIEFFSIQKCQAKGQKLKLLRIKVWKIVSLFNLFK
jgi:kynurenine formamidase